MTTQAYTYGKRFPVKKKVVHSWMKLVCFAVARERVRRMAYINHDTWTPIAPNSTVILVLSGTDSLYFNKISTWSQAFSRSSLLPRESRRHSRATVSYPTKRCNITTILQILAQTYWHARNPVADQVLITDVTVNLKAVTIRECKTKKGFFRERDSNETLWDSRTTYI